MRPVYDEDVEVGALPIFRPHELDSIPLLALAQDISDLIVSSVDTSLKYDQLKSPQVYALLVKPIVVKIKEEFLNGGTFFALMANKIHFGNEASSDLASAGLWTTRSLMCEIVAIKLISAFSRETLAQNMLFEFYPLSDGQNTSYAVVPNWLRVSCLELAIHGESKRFLNHPALVELVSDLWNGMLVFDPLLYKAHRINIKSRNELSLLIESHRGLICRYDLSSVSKFKLSRLRVPRYRHIAKVLSMFILVLLYLSLLGQRSLEFTSRELIFSAWAIAFSLDEIESLRKAGSELYFQTLWSTCDFFTVLLLIVYWLLRVVAVMKQSVTMNSWAYDVLATIAVGLIPRVFCVLEASEGFSRMVISVRKMSIELLYSWSAVMIFSLGFWAALCRFGDGFKSPSVILYELVQILFGYTPAVWTSWQNYSPLGAVVLFLYLFMTQFVVLTLVIAALSARYRDIQERSIEEYHYLAAVKVMAKIKTERSTLFCYAEPLNILALVLKPLIYVLPIRVYLILNRTMVKVTHMPLLFGIYAYERVLWNLEVRKQQKEDRQNDRIKQQLSAQQTEPQSVPGKPDQRRTRRQARRPVVKLDRSMAKTSMLDLVETALSNNPHASVPGSTMPRFSEAMTNETLRGVIPGLGPADVLSPRNGNALDALFRHNGDSNPHQNLNSQQTHQQRPFMRNRTYSTSSSVLRNFNTLKLSPTRSYRMFRGDNVQAETDAEEDIDLISIPQEEDPILGVIEDLESSNRRLESLILSLIAKVEDIDSRVHQNT